MFEIQDVEISFCSQRFATPLHLSSGVIEELTQATVAIHGTAGGQRATGRGTVYLSDLWAWPDHTLSHDRRDAALRRLCDTLVAEIPKYFRNVKLHPLDLGLQLHHLACHELATEPVRPCWLGRCARVRSMPQSTMRRGRHWVDRLLRFTAAKSRCRVPTRTFRKRSLQGDS